LSYGTPVLASDHPVHREVGGQACQYFPADAPAELARLIQVATTDHFQILRNQANNFRALTWEQSFRQLLADAILASSRHSANLRLKQSFVSSPSLATPANTRAA
jgi:hypothetical protein